MAPERSRWWAGAWSLWPGTGPLAAIGAVTLGLATATLGGLALSAAVPGGGLGVIVALGLATDAEDSIARLIDRVERVADGEEDVSLPTDRDDEVGDLATALEDLTGTLADCRQDRAAAEERAAASEERLDRYRTLVESAGDPMAALDAAGRFEVLNREMAAFHGQDRQALVGADATELVSPECVATIEDAQRRLLDDPAARWEQVEVTLTDAAGTEHRFEAKVGVRTDDEGGFTGSVVTFRDMTERAAVEAALREHERSLEARKDRLEAHNRALRGLYEIGADVDLTLAEKIQRVLDLGREHLGTDGAFLSRIDRESDHFEFVHTSGTGETLRPGTVAPFSETYCRKTIGTEGVLEVADAAAAGWTGDPAYDRWGFDRYVGGTVFVEGDLVGTIGFVDADAAAALHDDQLTFVDLAAQWLGYELERQQREERLAEYKKYTDDVLDAVDDVFYVLDDAGTLKRWNRSLVTATGYDDAAIADMHALEFFPADEEAHVAASIEEVFETGSATVEADLLTTDGDRIPYEFVATRLEDTDGNPVVTGIGRDITERTERQRELRETRDRLEAIIEASPAALIALDLDDRVTRWNPAAEDIFGWTEAEVLGEPLPTAPGDDLAADHQQYFERVLDGETITGAETTRRTKDGDLIDVSLSIAPIRDADGEIVGTMGALQDITERKERERALRATNERLNAVVEASPDAIVVIDTDGVVELWNPAAEDIFGWSAAEVTGEPLPFVPPDRTDEFDAFRDRLLDGETLTGVETERQTTDGDLVDVNLSAAPLRENGEVVGIMGIIEDISRRKAYERELERTTSLLSRAEEMAGVGGWSVEVVDGQPRDPQWTAKLYDIFELPPEAEPPTREVFEYYHPEDRERHRAALDRALETGEPWDQELRLTTAEGTERWVRNIGEPVTVEGEVVQISGSIQDITARKERERELREREQAIRSLHDAAQGLLGTETTAAVASLVVETAASVLDVSGVCLYVLDGEAGQLAPAAATDSFEAVTDGAPPIPVGDEGEPVWNAFATGSRRVVDERAEAEGRGPFTDTVTGGLIVPVGDHGVLVVTTTNPGVAVETRHLVETLVATTEAALDRLETEADLRERDAELAEQNRRLRRQIQLTDVIRRVDRSLVGANSEPEIEEAVCEELADSEDIAFAWIGSLDAAGETMVPETWAGAGEGYLDAVTLSPDARGEPAARTASAGEPTAVSNVLADVSGEPWRKTALDAGFRSVVAVPIAFEDYRHGVLAVYATEAETFGDLEETVFAELGQTIANAINAVKTREALHADTLLELTLEIDAPETFLAQVARRADCDVTYVGLGAQSDETTSLFFAADADAPVEAALDDMVAVTGHRRLSERDDRRVYEVTVRGATLPATLLRHGGHPTDITATPAGLSVVAVSLKTTDVREFVEMLEESHQTVDLAGRRNVTRPTRTHQELVSDLLADLTDRQLEVLRTAYFAGYYDWPRDSSGQEVADLLGISQPTVSRHLRLAQRQLLAELLEEEPPTLTTS